MKFTHIFKNIRIRLGESMVYTLVWCAIFLIPFMNAHLMSEHQIDWNKVVISCGKIAPYFIVFIVNNSILAPYLLLKHRYWLYSGLLLALVTLIFGTIEILDFRYWQFDINLRNKASLTELEWYWNILFSIMMAGANSMIKLFYRSIYTEQRMAILERENIETQMQYLKYQINPHFLMNTLNNIYAMIDFDRDMARQSVMGLSKMMRHVLYDSSESITTLDKEVEFLHNYIELMRIRYIDDVDIEFNIPDINTCRRIQLPPLLYIVLIENAFKHGISYNSKSFIKISITTDNKTLSCIVANSRHHTQATEHSGIGLNNIKKRLDLLFGDNYTLSTDDSDKSIYLVELIIPLTE